MQTPKDTGLLAPLDPRPDQEPGPAQADEPSAIPAFILWLRNTRHTLLMTRRELAARAGISDATLRSLEFCRYPITPEQRAKLVAAIAERDPTQAAGAPEL